MGTFHDPTSQLLGSLMDAASMRARVLAGNVANQNTPGYERQYVRFEGLLKTALERSRRLDPATVQELRPSVEQDRASPARADGNNVNLELEMSAMRQNRLLYEMYASIQASRSELLRTAIESGR